MPLSKLQVKPGINRETTNYANEGGFFNGDKVRFRGGYPQKIGGWQNITSSGSTYKGVARILWNYVTTFSQNLLGVGTNQKVYVEFGGTYNDITPIRSTVTLGANPISTTSGSKLVTISATGHGASLNSYVSISGATAVGGLTISGEYEIVDIPTADTFQIIASANASSTASGGGAAVVATFLINAGPATQNLSIGWGGPPWGAGGWGGTTPVGVPTRLWSMLNYGDDLMFAARQGDIYYWTRDTTTWNRAVTLEDKANTVPKSITTGTFSSGAITMVVTDASGINTGSVLSGTGIASGTYVTTAWGGGLTLTLSDATVGSGTVAVTASYAGRHVPNDTMLIINSPVDDFIICMGSNPYNPTNFTETFDPMLVRWSDQDNPMEWVPETTNQSGEKRLSNGSYIVAALNTRQEVLIWTDIALFSMQYIGPPFVWGINLLDDDVSIASQNAAINVNNITYWMGRDKFFVYSGRVETLPCSVRQYVFNDLNEAQIEQIICGNNEAFSEIWWFYPSTNSVVNDRYVIFNYLENTWSFGSMNRCAWSDTNTRTYPMLAFSVQNSYLSQAVTSSDTSVPLYSTVTYPATGVVIVGSEKIYYAGISGNTLINCIRGYDGTIAASHEANDPANYEVPNQVMFHEIEWDDQSTGVAKPIEAFIETSDFDIGQNFNFGFVSRIIPDVKFNGSTSESPSITITVKPREFSGSNYGPAYSNTVTRTATYPVEQYTGQIYTRIRGRQMAFRLDSTGLGVAWQMGNMRIDARADGKR